MSVAKKYAARYRLEAAKHHSAADRMSRQGNCKTFERIARKRALLMAKRAETASRWDQMSRTPLCERPGGFPGDPHNNRPKVHRGAIGG